MGRAYFRDDRRKVELCFVFAVLGSAALTRADNVTSGSDMFITLDRVGACSTYETLTLPAGFFGAGSAALTNVVVCFEGSPLTGSGVNGADTIVERLEAALVPGCGDSDAVPIRFRALSLVSSNPISVSFSAGGPSSYEVRVYLANVAQPNGSMTINHDCPEGGTFSSSLPCIPRLVFTRVSGTSGLASVTLDPAGRGPSRTDPIIFTSGGVWSHTDPGLFGIVTSPGGTVDHDGNPGTAQVAFPATSNFIVGVEWSPCDCSSNVATGDPQPAKTLTQEQEALAVQRKVGSRI